MNTNSARMKFEFLKSHRDIPGNNELNLIGALPWWCPDMEMLVTFLNINEGSPLVSPMECPRKGSVIRDFYHFFYVILNKLLNKESGLRWFEAPWRACDVTVLVINENIDVMCQHEFRLCFILSSTKRVWKQCSWSKHPVDQYCVEIPEEYIFIWQSAREFL